MKDIGKVKLTMQPQKKSLQKVWEWLEKYVAPSLKLFAEVGKIEQRDYIGKSHRKWRNEYHTEAVV